MPVYRAQIRYSSGTGDPADDSVNTLHFQGLETELDNAADMIEDFWNDATDQSSALAGYVGTNVCDGDAEINFYDLDDAQPRAPKYTRAFSLLTPSANSVGPAQMACCFSFEAATVSGESQARRRNRIYLPGIRAVVLTADGLFNGGFINDVAKAGEKLKAASAASVNMDWVVYSQTKANGGGSTAAGVMAVDNGWADNSPDIIRRRKVAATSRSTFT